MNANDKIIVRDLAKQYMEIALSDRQKKANKHLADILLMFGNAGYDVSVHMTRSPGDAMVAALTASLLEKQSLAETARNAICAGAFACTAESTIHPNMSKEAIETLRKSEENML